MFVTKDISVSEPADLNFAVEGNMTATLEGQMLECSDVRFGQGSSNASNNWWAGRPARSDETPFPR